MIFFETFNTLKDWETILATIISKKFNLKNFLLNFVAGYVLQKSDSLLVLTSNSTSLPGIGADPKVMI